MMTRRRRQPAALTIGALLVALFAGGCGASARSIAATTHPRSGTVTIKIWNSLNAPVAGIKNKFWFNKAVAMFERSNPKIKVKVLNTPNAASSAFETLLRSSEVAGNTPDVGELFTGGQVTQNGRYLVTLNKVLPSRFEKSLYTGWQFATGGFKKGGPIWGVPYGAGSWYFVYYNKALFARVGVKVPSPSARWPELISLARKIKAAGITPFVFGEKEGYFGAWTQDALISEMLGTNGVLRMYFGKRSVDSAPIIKAYTAWHSLFADGLTNSNAVTLPNAQGIAQFAAGKGAMTITGAFEDQTLLKGLGKKLDIFPVPALPGSRYPHALSGGPGATYVIFKSTTHRKQALKLIEFLSSTKVQTTAIGPTGQLPNDTSYVPGKSLQRIDPILGDMYKYVRVKHYKLLFPFDNIMPGSIDAYWYQTNNGDFGGSLKPAAAARSLETQMRAYLSTQKAG